jgi:AcrR family transcriptional regulator
LGIHKFEPITNVLDSLYTERYNADMDNRVVILQTALELFAARGYDAVGVQEIALTAGVTKPTLYHYYGSKEGLLDVVLQTYFDPLIRRVAAACDYNHDLPLSLNKTAAAFFEYAIENPVFYRMQLSMNIAPLDGVVHRLVTVYQEKLLAILEMLFKQAAEDHGNMIGREAAYALTFIGMVNAYIVLFLADRNKLNDQVLHQAVHQFMHGVFS